MKIWTIALLASLVCSTSAMAFSLPKVDSNQAKLNACITQEAQQALVKGTLTKANIDKQAEKIAATCATKLALKNDPATTQLAVTIINGLVK
jgi:adenylosuccinate lyase